MIRLRSHSPQETERLGALLGACLRAGDVVCLSGGLGAGKTTLCRGIGAGWGACDALKSPSYNLVHEHRRGQDDMRLYHLDCYRLSGEPDADSLGIDLVLDGSGAALIEWSERIEAALRCERLHVDIDDCGESQRELQFSACGARHIALLANFLRAVEAGY